MPLELILLCAGAVGLISWIVYEFDLILTDLIAGMRQDRAEARNPRHR